MGVNHQVCRQAVGGEGHVALPALGAAHALLAVLRRQLVAGLQEPDGVHLHGHHVLVVPPLAPRDGVHRGGVVPHVQHDGLVTADGGALHAPHFIHVHGFADEGVAAN